MEEVKSKPKSLSLSKSKRVYKQSQPPNNFKEVEAAHSHFFAIVASMLMHLRRINPLGFRPSISYSLKLFSTLLPNPSAVPQTLPSTPDPTEPLTKPQLEHLVLRQYSHGKFFNLVQNVVALPAVLLTACQNLTTRRPNNALKPPDSSSLLHYVSKRFDIADMGRELCENRFDVKACCVTMLPSRKKGVSAVRCMKVFCMGWLQQKMPFLNQSCVILFEPGKNTSEGKTTNVLAIITLIKN